MMLLQLGLSVTAPTSASSSTPSLATAVDASSKEVKFDFWGHTVSVPVEAALLQQAVEPVLEQPYMLNGLPQQTLLDMSKESYSQCRQDKTIEPILSNLGTGKFFVESGAFDGESSSNSLYYERKYGWTGLLVEPDPKSFGLLQGKHRNAYAFHGCLSPSKEAMTLQFHVQGAYSQLDSNGNYPVQAHPLHSLLETIGQKTVDFWSLDIEGSESQVLQNTDFAKVEVGVLLIEMDKNSQNNNAIQDVMHKEGFIDIGHTLCKDNYILDHIFVNPEYFKKRSLAVPTSMVLDPPYRK